MVYENSRGLRLAVASGKGGTGKTTVAVNLALAAAAEGAKPVYIDCDVEEPNGSIFLKPTISASEPVFVSVPVIDEAKCSGCGECGRFCRFNAILCVKGTPLTFPELCHHCGGCALVCPERAIREEPHQIGVIERGQAGDVRFLAGRLRIGAPASPPLIRAVKRAAGNGALQIVDAPPGAACPAVEAVRNAALVLLVTEPTPFGLHDLKITVEMLREMGLPMAAAINRAGLGDGGVEEFCSASAIPVLARIPHDRRIAEAYSKGQPIIRALPEFAPTIRELLRGILELIHS